MFWVDDVINQWRFRETKNRLVLLDEFQGFYYSLQTRAHSPRNSAPADRCRIQNSGITVLEKRVHRVETGSLSLSLALYLHTFRELVGNYHLWLSRIRSRAPGQDDVFFQECPDSRIDSGFEIARSFTKKTVCVTGVCQYGRGGGDDKTVAALTSPLCLTFQGK